MKMSNLWKNVSKEITRREQKHSLSALSISSEFQELFELSPSTLLDFQQVKKWRQKKSPRKKGFPTEKNYETHQQFYERYKKEFQTTIDPHLSLDKMP
ncbi:hypothetical protein K7V47_002625 [Enterococcus faecalis]|uniref:hypothetical protein n=2 Tax=Enterococcus faecalis TaxID=1351 RepID=UPI0019DB9476|nr:hypothetical protein [Enterococcus faecalis]EIA8297618.1 hypothetical protein [Enterococcus faecalis]